MRERPFLSTSEGARPYGEIVAERNAGDVAHLARQRTLREIAAIEAEAADLTDPLARKLRQCDAEQLRSALEENRRV